jgi:hypothetical protein
MNDRLFFVFFSLVVTHEHVYSFAQQLFRWVLETIWFSSISKAKLARPDKFSRQSKIVSRSLTPVWYRQRSEESIVQNGPFVCSEVGRELGSHESSPRLRLQLQLLVVGKTSGTSLSLGEQRAPDYRGYRSPSLSASVLLAGSPSIRSPRGCGASPLDASHPSPQPHTTSETPLPIHRSELRQRFRGVRSVLLFGVEIHTGVG